MVIFNNINNYYKSHNIVINYAINVTYVKKTILPGIALNIIILLIIMKYKLKIFNYKKMNKENFRGNYMLKKIL